MRDELVCKPTLRKVVGNEKVLEGYRDDVPKADQLFQEDPLVDAAAEARVRLWIWKVGRRFIDERTQDCYPQRLID